MLLLTGNAIGSPAMLISSAFADTVPECVRAEGTSNGIEGIAAGVTTTTGTVITGIATQGPLSVTGTAEPISTLTDGIAITAIGAPIRSAGAAFSGQTN